MAMGTDITPTPIACSFLSPDFVIIQSRGAINNEASNAMDIGPGALFSSTNRTVEKIRIKENTEGHATCRNFRSLVSPM